MNETIRFNRRWIENHMDRLREEIKSLTEMQVWIKRCLRSEADGQRKLTYKQINQKLEKLVQCNRRMIQIMDKCLDDLEHVTNVQEHELEDLVTKTHNIFL